MFEKLHKLYLDGQIERLTESLKEQNEESRDITILKALRDAISESNDEKERIIADISKIVESDELDSLRLSTIGTIYTILGELDKAEDILLEATKREPVSAIALIRYGNIALVKGKLDEAEEALLSGLEREELAEAYLNLAYLYTITEREEQAVELYEKAFITKPYSRKVSSKVLEILKEKEKIEELYEKIEAEKDEKQDKTQRALRLIALGILEYEKGEVDEALLKIARASIIEEDNEAIRDTFIDYFSKEERWWVLGSRLIDWTQKYKRIKEHISLAECRIEAGFLEKAKEGLEAIEDRIESEKLEYKMVWAKYYKENEEQKEALKILEELHEDYPHYMPVAIQLSDLYNSLGEKKKALHLLEEMGKDAIPVLIRRMDAAGDLSREDIEKLEEHLNAVDDTDVRISIQFALASGYDRLSEYQKAAEHLQTANEKTYEKLDYSIEEFRKEIDNIIEAYDAQWLKRKQNRRAFDKRPIFIVGMPRSVTTMLEQIFAAHGSVFGAGELSYVNKVIKLSEKITKKSYPESLTKAPRRLIEQAGEYYLHLAKKLYEFDEPVLVDKLPHNFMHSALLLAMFPDSKVIALRRDYRSIALSNYFQNFAAKKGTLGYAFDMEAMGEHIKDYIRVMNHYREILPSDRYREFWYEDLVLHPQEKIPEVVEFCDLDFTPKLLEFYKNKTAVKTASILQVRNPIYTKSIAKWKNYEDMLAPLIEIVGEEGIYKDER